MTVFAAADALNGGQLVVAVADANPSSPVVSIGSYDLSIVRNGVRIQPSDGLLLCFARGSIQADGSGLCLGIRDDDSDVFSCEDCVSARTIGETDFLCGSTFSSGGEYALTNLSEMSNERNDLCSSDSSAASNLSIAGLLVATMVTTAAILSVLA